MELRQKSTNMSKRIVAAVGVVGALAFTGCAQAPKDSYVQRVRAVCGPDIAAEYAGTKWRDRDYAHDALLTSCMAFRDR